jgi:hypothetical protein
MRFNRVPRFIRVICYWLFGGPLQSKDIILDCVVEDIIEASCGELQIVVAYRTQRGWGRTTLSLPSECQGSWDPQRGEELSVTVQVVGPIPGWKANHFTFKSWSVIGPRRAATSSDDTAVLFSDDDGPPQAFSSLSPFWIWAVVMCTMVALSSLGALGEWNYDYFRLGSLLWLSGHFTVICWSRISATRTDIRLESHESHTLHVRHWLAEAWRASPVSERLVASYAIFFSLLLLMVLPPMPGSN